MYIQIVNQSSVVALLAHCIQFALKHPIQHIEIKPTPMERYPWQAIIHYGDLQEKG